MQLPKRQSQLLKQSRGDDDETIYLTAQGIQHLKNQIADLEEHQRPIAVEDVSRSVQLGDLSENAEYQEAKHRLARIDGRCFSLHERLKRAIEIHTDPANADRVQMGSSVTIKRDGACRVYQIVGPQETNPTQGRISHLSPLGAALLNHRVGDRVPFPTCDGVAHIEIVEIRLPNTLQS